MKNAVNPYFVLPSLRKESSSFHLSSVDKHLLDHDTETTKEQELQIPYNKLLFTSEIPHNLICESCNSLMKVFLFFPLPFYLFIYYFILPILIDAILTLGFLKSFWFFFKLQTLLHSKESSDRQV